MLIDCRECKGQVSDKADNCPHCGVAISSLTSEVNAGAAPKVGLSIVENVVQSADKAFEYKMKLVLAGIGTALLLASQTKPDGLLAPLIKFARSTADQLSKSGDLNPIINIAIVFGGMFFIFQCALFAFSHIFKVQIAPQAGLLATSTLKKGEDGEYTHIGASNIEKTFQTKMSKEKLDELKFKLGRLLVFKNELNEDSILLTRWRNEPAGLLVLAIWFSVIWFFSK